jgi:Leucine-rich repeat (LRR) protein
MKMKSLILPVLTGILLLSFAFASLSAQEEPPKIPLYEREALIAFFNATNGSNWYNKSGWLGKWGTEKNWFGVSVVETETTANVVGIFMNGNNLSGFIPASIKELIHLKTLDLGTNKLSGNIPSELGNLSNLVELNLRNNQLSGSIPEELGNLKNLQNLTLSDNFLTGNIPSSLGNLRSLQSLILNNNLLTGNIPSSLGNLLNLKDLHLINNRLSGSIPKELGNLKNLESLYLACNKYLSGSIPVEIGNLSKLKGIELRDNQLSGDIPKELGNLSNLEWICMDTNQLTRLPNEIGKLTKLRTICLTTNRLRGSIPAELGNLKNLEWISLSHSELSGSIPPQLENLTKLKELHINVNKLTGNIPPELGKLKNLGRFCLDNNQLSGSIPSELGDLTNLTQFTLGSNQLSGNIPSELGNFKELTSLTLDRNRLSGEIPTSLTKLTKLAKPNVDIGYNCLYTDDPTLIQWLNDVDPDWEMNQNNCQGIEQGIKVKSPNGGERLMIGTVHSIQWTSVGIVGNIRIKYLTDNGNFWITITESAPNKGSYSWTVPNTPSDLCKIKIEEASDGNPTDMSDSFFSITGNNNNFEDILNELTTPKKVLKYMQDHFSLGFHDGCISYAPSTFFEIKKGDCKDYSTFFSYVINYHGYNAEIVSFRNLDKNGNDIGGHTVTMFEDIDGTLKYSSNSYFILPVKSLNDLLEKERIRLKVDKIGNYQLFPAGSTDVCINEGSYPFGEFSTPIDGSTLSGSIAVTGWALDDIGVENVKLYRGEVGNLTYIGDAIFVEGARPDVEQAYPGYPMNYKAGWGYMMLTNFLPGGGNGEFKIHAVVKDAEGHQITLGTKTIRCDNAHAVKPFGAIDTPTQGGTASGKNFVNWGWALTPLPNKIPEDGSTINIWVDGKNIGHPTYNIYREDIATLFPGYKNSNGAIGYFYLDTSGYENGIHTIQWTATDNAGNTDGIGSRYFSILNNGESSSNSQSTVKYRHQNDNNSILNSPLEEIPMSNIEPLRIEKGIDEIIHCIEPDENGIYFIEIEELERLEVVISDSSAVAAGFILVGAQLKTLPVGTTLCEDTGKFYWTPGPGFVGSYHFVFIERDRNNYLSRKEVIVDIRPKSTTIHH